MIYLYTDYDDYMNGLYMDETVSGQILFIQGLYAVQITFTIKTAKCLVFRHEEVLFLQTDGRDSTT